MRRYSQRSGGWELVVIIFNRLRLFQDITRFFSLVLKIDDFLSHRFLYISAETLTQLFQST